MSLSRQDGAARALRGVTDRLRTLVETTEPAQTGAHMLDTPSPAHTSAGLSGIGPEISIDPQWVNKATLPPDPAVMEAEVHELRERNESLMAELETLRNERTQKPVLDEQQIETLIRTFEQGVHGNLEHILAAFKDLADKKDAGRFLIELARVADAVENLGKSDASGERSREQVGRMFELGITNIEGLIKKMPEQVAAAIEPIFAELTSRRVADAKWGKAIHDRIIELRHAIQSSLGVESAENARLKDQLTGVERLLAETKAMLEKALKENTALIHDLGTNMREYGRERGSLRQRNDALQSDAHAVREEMAELRAYQSALESQLAEVRHAHDALQAAREAEVKLLDDQLEARNWRITRLGTRIKAQDAAHNANAALTAKLQNKVWGNERRIREILDSNEQLKTALETAEKTLKSVQADFASFKREHDRRDRLRIARARDARSKRLAESRARARGNRDREQQKAAAARVQEGEAASHAEEEKKAWDTFEANAEIAEVERKIQFELEEAKDVFGRLNGLVIDADAFSSAEDFLRNISQIRGRTMQLLHEKKAGDDLKREFDVYIRYLDTTLSALAKERHVPLSA